jgi:hypothetical protein
VPTGRGGLVYRPREGASPVSPSEEFGARAQECFRWAQLAVSASGKKLWLSMALLWLDRAATADHVKGWDPPLSDSGSTATRDQTTER